PLHRKRTAHDLWPLDCTTRYRPEPPSLISRRADPGLAFSTDFAVRRGDMCYPLRFGVTKTPLLPVAPDYVSLHSVQGNASTIGISRTFIYILLPGFICPDLTLRCEHTSV